MLTIEQTSRRYLRIESPEQVRDAEVVRPETLVLMNIDTRRGRAWERGVEVTDAEQLARSLVGNEHGWESVDRSDPRTEVGAARPRRSQTRR